MPAIPDERLRGVFTTRGYTNLRLPYLTLPLRCAAKYDTDFVANFMENKTNDSENRPTLAKVTNKCIVSQFFTARPHGSPCRALY